MDSEGIRSWPTLPKECLESIVRRGGPQTAASLSSTCKSWRKDLEDDLIWRSWHGLPLLRYHTWQSSYGAYARTVRSWLAGCEQAAAVVPHAHERWLTSLDLSPTHVLSGSLDTNVKYWDRSRPGAWVHYLRGHTGPVGSVRLACDGVGSTSTSPSSYRRAYSGSRDGTLRCWDLSTGTCVRAYTLDGGRQWVNTVAVWRPQQQQHLTQLLQRAAGPGGLPAAAAAAEGGAAAAGVGAAAAAGGFRHGAAIGGFGAMGGGAHGAIGAAAGGGSWGASTSTLPSEPPAASCGPMAVVCGTSIGQLCLYDVRQSVPAQRLLVDLHRQAAGPPPGAVYGVAVYGDNLAAACASGCIYVWDLRAGAVRHRLDEHGSACTCVAMYGDTIVAGDLEGSVYLWSTQEGGGGGGAQFRGGLATATAGRRFHQAAAAATTAGSSAAASALGSPTATAAAAGGGGTAAVAAAHIPAGPRWPCWRPHRRRAGLFDKPCKISNGGDSSSSSGGSSDDDDADRDRRRSGGRGLDGAAAVAALEALADSRAATLPYYQRQPLPPPQTAGSPWLRSQLAGAAAAATAAGPLGVSPSLRVAAAAGDAPPLPPPPPRLRAVMRHTEWVRDVVLLGPMLVLSCSKDGLVCLSRTDSMQVVAVWDVAATVGGGGGNLRPDAMGSAGGDGGPRAFGGGGEASSSRANHGGSSSGSQGSRGECGVTGGSGGGSGGGGGGVSQIVNQVHALAADEWGFVAGCQDASMRMVSFAPGGALPELSSPSYGGEGGRRSAGLGGSLSSVMRELSC